jgi:hypothetical protein
MSSTRVGDVVGAYFFRILGELMEAGLGICKSVQKETHGLFVLTDREPPQGFNVELSCIPHAVQTVTDF